jgi:hypothetical protein
VGSNFDVPWFGLKSSRRRCNDMIDIDMKMQMKFATAASCLLLIVYFFDKE